MWRTSSSELTCGWHRSSIRSRGVRGEIGNLRLELGECNGQVDGDDPSLAADVAELPRRWPGVECAVGAADELELLGMGVVGNELPIWIWEERNFVEE
ncbi:hypothetical protein RchiOBHm_Chr5g0004431 [Rosa chinensis]|uniref:Uncharacterized protein n=1 Tax=Rosa chinensis TaxID=74649 RepID=A0A2P6Q323_ROSCH|nr:hypothetical protein RchiOBHm_Chr5g0004431 [Rosa chinensis]